MAVTGTFFLNPGHRWFQQDMTGHSLFVTSFPGLKTKYSVTALLPEGTLRLNSYEEP